MNETLIILEKIHSFYSQAWSQLIIYTTALFGFVGILVPILVQFYQKMTLKVEKKSLEKIIKETVEDTEQGISEYVSEAMEKQRSQIEEKINAAAGGNFHLQGNYYMDKNMYNIALDSFAIAGLYYVKAKEEVNLGRIIRIIKKCLPKMKKEDFSGTFQQNEKKMEEFLSALKEYNTRGRYNDDIDDLEEAFNLAVEKTS